jgi:hypothetical protein
MSMKKRKPARIYVCASTYSVELPGIETVTKAASRWANA